MFFSNFIHFGIYKSKSNMAESDIEDANCEIAESEDIPLTYEIEKPVKKNGKRKAEKKKRTWSEDEVVHLIELWSSQEIIYNVKHKLYFNKTDRQKCVEKIHILFASNDMSITCSL